MKNLFIKSFLFFCLSIFISGCGQPQSLKKVNIQEMISAFTSQINNAWLLYEDGQYSSSYDIVHNILVTMEKYDNPEFNRLKSDALSLKALIYCEDENTPEAMSIAEEALTYNPRNPYAFFALGKAYFIEGNKLAASQEFFEASENILPGARLYQNITQALQASLEN